MRSGIILACLSVIVFTSHTSGAAESAGPSPNLLYQLQKQNHTRPWWHVTSDSGRVQVRIAQFDRFGLTGVEAAPEGPRAQSRIPWFEVSRLDEVETRAHAGRVLGAVAGTLLGAGIVNVLWPDEHGSWVFGGGGLLGIAGGWAGGRLGERRRHDRAWYERQAVRLGSALDAARHTGSAADSVQAGGADASAAGLASKTSATSITDLPTVLRASARIQPGDLLRVRGGFGQFEGHVSIVGPEGLDRIEATTSLGVPAPRGPLSWDRIDRVQKRVGCSRRGALIGGVLTGTAGFAFGFELAGTADYPTLGDRIGGGFYFGLPAAAIGGAVGALLGIPVPRWHTVYERP